MPYSLTMVPCSWLFVSCDDFSLHVFVCVCVSSTMPHDIKYICFLRKCKYYIHKWLLTFSLFFQRVQKNPRHINNRFSWQVSVSYLTRRRLWKLCMVWSHHITSFYFLISNHCLWIQVLLVLWFCILRIDVKSRYPIYFSIVSYISVIVIVLIDDDDDGDDDDDVLDKSVNMLNELSPVQH